MKTNLALKFHTVLKGLFMPVIVGGNTILFDESVDFAKQTLRTVKPRL